MITMILTAIVVGIARWTQMICAIMTPIYEDQHPSIHPTSCSDLGPNACFLQSMPDYSDMTQQVFTRAVDALLPRSAP
jgi:hypothetical protein